VTCPDIKLEHDTPVAVATVCRQLVCASGCQVCIAACGWRYSEMFLFLVCTTCSTLNQRSSSIRV